MSGLREVNLKFDMPCAGEAQKRLEQALRQSAAMGCAALKLIHGYGSTGRGGRIRLQTRRCLENEKRLGRIRAVIPGEHFSIFDEETRRAFLRCPDLREDPDLDRSNNGVTIVIL